MVTKKILKEYLEWYQESPQILSQRVIALSEVLFDKSKPNTSDLALLDQSDYFFEQARKVEKQDLSDKYFHIGKILRWAAHTVYFSLLKKDKTKAINARFLNVIEGGNNTKMAA